jgi:DNA-binding MarR family transcriptional regulator
MIELFAGAVKRPTRSSAGLSPGLASVDALPSHVVREITLLAQSLSHEHLVAVDEALPVVDCSYAKRTEGLPVPSLSPDVKADVDQVLEAIIYLSTETRRLTKELARRANVTGPQLTVVKLLETIGDLSLSELSDKIRAQNSTVTGIVDRMEREGLAQRVRSTEDRRVVRIRLTEKGQKLAAEIPVEPMEILRTALGGLTPVETQELLRIMSKVAKRIGALVRQQALEPI